MKKFIFVMCLTLCPLLASAEVSTAQVFLALDEAYKALKVAESTFWSNDSAKVLEEGIACSRVQMPMDSAIAAVNMFSKLHTEEAIAYNDFAAYMQRIALRIKVASKVDKLAACKDRSRRPLDRWNSMTAISSIASDINALRIHLDGAIKIDPLSYGQ